MENALTGLRRRLRDAYGPTRQAEPLLGLPHIGPIARHLAGKEAPEAALARLLLELHAAGIDGGGALRLTLDSVLQPRRGVVAADAAANEALFADTGTVGLRSLLVPGRRRGRAREPDVLITLADQPELARALDAYLEQRPASGGNELLKLTKSNPSAHIREVLGRLAERGSVTWRPARKAWATAVEVRMMRTALDRGLGWTGQLRRQRDHVMVLVGYLCALRRSELCALTIADVSFVERGAVIRVSQSKTDQERRGASLPLHHVEDAARHLDAVGSLIRWVGTLRDEFGAGPDDPLFPALARRGTPMRRRGALVPLDPQSWSDRLRELARDARVFGDDEQRYERVSGHSLRHGFVTTALLSGHDPISVAKQTRHKNVQMLIVYADELRILEGTSWAEVHFGDIVGLPGQSPAAANWAAAGPSGGRWG